MTKRQHLSSPSAFLDCPGMSHKIPAIGYAPASGVRLPPGPVAPAAPHGARMRPATVPHGASMPGPLPPERGRAAPSAPA